MARRPRAVRGAPAPTTDDPIELAMEAEASGVAPTGPALALLQSQNRLIGWQINTERAAFALKLLTAVVGVVVAVIVTTILVSASQYRGLTIQPFSVPPELEARGLTGSVVATRLLDRLSAIQADTTSLRAPNTYANSWGDEVAVEIPQTGVSAGELWRFLRAWLGQEVKITGEVVSTPEGLEVGARAGGQAAPVFTVPEEELQSAIDQAAESVFASTQPYRYAIYLSRKGRTEEAIAAIMDLSRSGSHTDRLWALSGGTNMMGEAGRFESAVNMARGAIRLDPHFGLAWANLGGVELALGQMEASYRHGLRSAELMENDEDLNPEIAAGFLLEMRGAALAAEHDHAGAVAIFARAAEADAATGRGVRASQAVQMAMLRDVSAGRRVLGSVADVESADGRRQVLAFEPVAALALEDWPAAVRALEAFASTPDTTPAERVGLAANVLPVLAYARARAGDRVGAGVALTTSLPHSDYTLLARAQLAALWGDHAASDRHFADLQRRTPSLADAELAWGQARSARGDRVGAIVLFEQAHRQAPRWADPLKFWGDALGLQGDHRGAIRRYRAAAERAPRWGALHLAWGRALEAGGEAGAARAKYRAAAGMDLSPADRAEVARRVQRPATP